MGPGPLGVESLDLAQSSETWTPVTIRKLPHSAPSHCWNCVCQHRKNPRMMVSLLVSLSTQTRVPSKTDANTYKCLRVPLKLWCTGRRPFPNGPDGMVHDGSILSSFNPLVNLLANLLVKDRDLFLVRSCVRIHTHSHRRLVCLTSMPSRQAATAQSRSQHVLRSQFRILPRLQTPAAQSGWLWLTILKNRESLFHLMSSQHMIQGCGGCPSIRGMRTRAQKCSP